MKSIKYIGIILFFLGMSNRSWAQWPPNTSCSTAIGVCADDTTLYSCCAGGGCGAVHLQMWYTFCLPADMDSTQLISFKSQFGYRGFTLYGPFVDDCSDIIPANIYTSDTIGVPNPVVFTFLPAGKYYLRLGVQECYGYVRIRMSGFDEAPCLACTGAPCEDAECHDNILNISTGYNQVTSTYNSPLALETNWTLVGIPTNAAITLPAPCWDISPHPAWSNFTNAKWVSPFQNNAYSVNNWPPATYGAFEFQKCFCVCDSTTLDIDFEMLVDDGGEVLLDGVSIATAFLGYQFQWLNRLIVDTTAVVGPGTHCLTVKLYNSGGVAMGFALEGNVTGANLLASVCCNPNGRICGTKINDTNCDGAINPAVDPGLSGWTMNLFDDSNNLLATTVTDEAGNYCFSDLPPGNYVVKEVNQPGWSQTYPASGPHNISLPAGGVVNASFGNCENDSIPCENCIGSFAPQPGKKYLISAWAKESGAPLNKTAYTYPRVSLVFPNVSVTLGPFTPSGLIIDGWQRIETEFIIPAGADEMDIELSCATGDCYFDDIRVLPFDGSMKSYVYNPQTLRLDAELDERNYATMYEYDDEGKLVRIKKETERGVMTIQESKTRVIKQ